jgi:hypothetical protein
VCRHHIIAVHRASSSAADSSSAPRTPPRGRACCSCPHVRLLWRGRDNTRTQNSRPRARITPQKTRKPTCVSARDPPCLLSPRLCSTTSSPAPCRGVLCVLSLLLFVQKTLQGLLILALNFCHPFAAQPPPLRSVIAAPAPRLQRAPKHLRAPSSLGASAAAAAGGLGGPRPRAPAIKVCHLRPRRAASAPGGK